MFLMRQRRARRVQLGQVHADRFQRPTGRAIAARPAAPHVLMRIDKHLDPVLARLLDHRAHVIQISLVVLAGTGVFNRLPRHQKAQESQPP